MMEGGRRQVKVKAEDETVRTVVEVRDREEIGGRRKKEG